MLGHSILALIGSTVITAAPALEPRQVTSNDSNGTSSDPCAALIPQDPRPARKLSHPLSQWSMKYSANLQCIDRVLLELVFSRRHLSKRLDRISWLSLRP
jgi:hypothetical protein